MAETRLLERLTASDLFMLLWDDYGWPNEIGGLAILDGANLLDPDGRVRIEAVRRQLEPRTHLVPLPAAAVPTPPGAGLARGRTPTPIPSAWELLSDNLRRRRQELGRGWSGLAHPRRTLRRARAAWPAWREVFTEQRAPRTSLNHPVGADRRLAIILGGGR